MNPEKKFARTSNLIKLILFLIFTLLLIYYILSILSPKPISSQVYYVAMNGSDNNPGTEEQPWRTITKAANTLVAGDTVYVKQGTYNERVIPQNSGTPGKYITYAAYSGNNVTIDGTGISIPEWNGLVEIRGKNYIKISGFRIMTSGWVGVFVPKGPSGEAYSNYGGSSYITIEKNYIYNTYSSAVLMQYGNNYIVDSNEIVLGNNALSNARVEEIISIQNNVDTFEVKNNHIYNSGQPQYGGEGIDAKWNVSNGKIYNNHIHDTKSNGIYVDSWVGSWYWGDNSQIGHGYARDIDVFNNIIHDTGGSGIAVSTETGGNVDRINIYNNIAYNNKRNGIMVPAYADESSPIGFIKNIKIINNLAYNNWEGGIAIGYWKTFVNNVTVRNNIFSQNQQYQIMLKSASDIQNIIVDNNLIDGYRNFTEGNYHEIKGSNYIEEDPQFVNPTSADFHLRSTSPAIDNGSPNGAPNTDFDGNSRPNAAGYDIGAFEYSNTTIDRLKK